MKKLVILLLVIALTGCGVAERFGAAVTGYTEQCVDGVMYLQFTSGATVKYKRDGTIWTC